ncbi:MAG TPA: hypothetical protein PK961_13645 [bacterium]|nr:hypothetical protein [bacterium]
MRSLGFAPAKARIVAYANQYTDDAVESDEFTLVGDGSFNPVRTAYYKLHLLEKIFDPAERKKKIRELSKLVWMSFHFLPGNQGSKSWEKLLVRPDSDNARRILHAALKKIDDGEANGYHALGVATHTYLDTFSHQNFSGHDGKENNAKADIELNMLSRDIDLKGWQEERDRFYLPIPDLAGNIGHMDVLTFPDMPYLQWNYKNWQDVDSGEIVNLNRFVRAYEKLFWAIGAWRGWSEEKIFKAWYGTSDDYNKAVHSVLLVNFAKNNLSKKARTKNWTRAIADKQKVFAFNAKTESANLDYHEDDWMNAALNVPRGLERELSGGATVEPKGDFTKSDFYHFHTAARAQRDMLNGWFKDQNLKP